MKPRRVRDALDELIRAVFRHEHIHHLAAELYHPLKKPRRAFAVVESERSYATLDHSLIIALLQELFLVHQAKLYLI